MPNSATRSATRATSDKALTSERIASDIAAFNKAGGRIEVLGNTPFLRKPGPAESTAGAPGATLPAKIDSSQK
nr:hypothetical protein [Dyella psychrodurans]